MPVISVNRGNWSTGTTSCKVIVINVPAHPCSLKLYAIYLPLRFLLAIPQHHLSQVTAASFPASGTFCRQFALQLCYIYTTLSVCPHNGMRRVMCQTLIHDQRHRNERNGLLNFNVTTATTFTTAAATAADVIVCAWPACTLSHRSILACASTTRSLT